MNKEWQIEKGLFSAWEGKKLTISHMCTFCPSVACPSVTLAPSSLILNREICFKY